MLSIKLFAFVIFVDFLSLVQHTLAHSKHRPNMTLQNTNAERYWCVSVYSAFAGWINDGVAPLLGGSMMA